MVSAPNKRARAGLRAVLVRRRGPRARSCGALLLSALALQLLGLGCGQGRAPADTDTSTTATDPGESEAGTGTGTGTGTDTDTDTDPIEPGRCGAPPGMGTPTTITEALELLNALPAPVDVPCVLESLDRPLAIMATSSRSSAQPAVDVQNPRIFIFSGSLILSVVPGGSGRDLLEFGELRGDGESLKGELHMPVELPVPAGKPYDHLRYSENITVCGFCHLDEHLAVELGHPNAYISRALRPDDDHPVELDDLRSEQSACDPTLEPERCAILSAIFSHGEVVEGRFPEGLGTIFDPP